MSYYAWELLYDIIEMLKPFRFIIVFFIIFTIYAHIEDFLEKRKKRIKSKKEEKQKEIKKAKMYSSFEQKVRLDCCYSTALLECLRNRKVKYLIHFTNVKNLNNILLNGIKPVSQLRPGEFIASDKQRLDKMLDCVSLSVEYPNYKYFWRLRQRHPDENYCVIKLNAIKTLINNKDKKYFLPSNAASYVYKEQRKDFLKIRFFELMFGKYPPKTYLPRNPQAEILYEGCISPDCIAKVYFPNDRTYLKFIKFLPEELKSKDMFEIDHKYFTKRGLVFWRERS